MTELEVHHRRFFARNWVDLPSGFLLKRGDQSYGLCFGFIMVSGE
jgi:hypothetical protein